ncbi:MAG: hypothetical protein H0X51_09755 [Parachlamydiaceae bacterium]|nr:hypothetical protein [Parachlamydiaceae bacterium]
MTVTLATMSQLPPNLIREIALFSGDLHVLARMRRISKVCRDSLIETDLAGNDAFKNLVHQFRVERLFRNNLKSLLCADVDVRANMMSQLTFSICTPTRTLITDQSNRNIYLLNESGESVLRTNGGQNQTSLTGCRQLSSVSDSTSYWNERGYHFVFNVTNNTLGKFEPAKGLNQLHPLQAAPFVFTIGENLFSIDLVGKISCFDKSGKLIKEQKLFEEGKYPATSTVKQVHQLGSHFLVLSKIKDGGPQQFFSVSGDAQLSVKALGSINGLTEFCEPLDSNGQSCFISYRDNVFQHFVAAITIKEEKLNVLWSSKSPPQPKGCTSSKKYVFIEGSTLLGGSVNHLGESTVLCAKTGKQLAVLPGCETATQNNNNRSSLRAKLIGDFLIRSYGDHLMVSNLATKKHVKIMSIPHNTLDRIHDVFFQGPGNHPTGLPLDRFYVLYTASPSLLHGTSQIMLRSYKTALEQPKQASAAPQEEAKAQAAAPQAEAKAQAAARVQPERATKKRRIGS